MPARILDGKLTASRVTDDIRARVAARAEGGRPAPGLAVVLVGENAASQIYVRNKRRTTEAVGMRSFATDLPPTASARISSRHLASATTTFQAMCVGYVR